MLEQEATEILDKWDPPQLCEEAANWLVSQLSPKSFLHFAQILMQDPEGQTALSGFRITQNSIKKSSVRQAITARLVPLLVSSKWVRSAFFLISFPHARWFRWAEVIEIDSETWLLENWRTLIKGTGDPALAIAFALDDRPSLAQKGERALRRKSLWKEKLSTSKELLPGPWAELSGLLREKDYRSPSETEALAGLQTRLDELSARLQRGEQEKVRLKKIKKKLESRIGDLEARCLEQNALVKAVKAKLKEQARHAKALEKAIDSEVEAGIARFYREFCNCDGCEQGLWEDSLRGRTKDLLKTVERALMAQARLDIRYGTRSRVTARLKNLESKYREVERAISDALVPTQALLKARKALQLEIVHWRQMLPGAEEAGSPLAEMILGQARAFGASEKGISKIEALLGELERPILQSLLNENEKESLRRRLQSVLAERKKTWQTLMVATHLPIRILSHEIEDISNLSAFILRHYDLCSDSVLLVDGYNAIKSSAEWATLDRHNFTRARERFIELWELRARDWARVELIFDGQERHVSVEEREHLMVVYTDTKFKSQNADLYIKSRMQDLKTEDPGTRLFLITADRELRESVSKWCDYFVEPRWALIPYLSIED
ncbi:MAG: hypothetical protein GWP10_00825 [Nitrospiraceae bacterium]|nr:hypothetical protein [Nitrospiraceae bacterium]